MKIISENVFGNDTDFRKRYRKQLLLQLDRWHIALADFFSRRINTMKHVTIKDVAKTLNVSVSSVSRAFNDKYDIKEETKLKILRVAKEMGYHPNPIARKLIQQKTFNVGVIVPEFIHEFFAEVIIGIQEVLTPKGYQVVVMQSDERPEVELNNAKNLVNNFVDGLIVCPLSEGVNKEFYVHQLESGYPMVFVGRVNESFPGSKVIFDNAKWSLFAAEHLIHQGFKTIYHLSGNENLCVARNRISGFLKAMQKHRIPEGNYKIVPAGLSAEDGERAVIELIAKNDLPTAFTCINDHVALGAMKVLKQNGYSIPEDIALVGFTEIKAANFVTPPLTSVKQPTFEMGKAAAEMLLSQIESGLAVPQNRWFDGQLNLRKSSEKT